MENKDKIILDLCGGTGAWSEPYRKAGYDVRNITLPDYDIINWEFDEQWTEVRMRINRGEIYGILAAPPCTMFSLARTKTKKPRDLREGMECVRACLNIIWSVMEVKQDTRYKTLPLKFWALENPKGMLEYFLGKPAFEFNPYDFGDQYQKRTCLWGHFNEPKKNPNKTNSQPLPKFDYMKSKDIHPEMFGKLTRQERRAITPAGFAKAFFNSNP